MRFVKWGPDLWRIAGETMAHHADERDAYLRSRGIRYERRPFARWRVALIQESEVVRDSSIARGRDGLVFRVDWRWAAMACGGCMEDTAHLLAAVNQEVAESKKTLEDLRNEVTALYDVIGPELLRQAKELRAARMTVVAEVREALGAMREVRKFFLESDYRTEVERLKEFVALCREMQELKATGVFDAVCDAAIRLAIKEQQS